MTKDDALKLALEALSDERYVSRYSQIEEAIAAIKEALEEPQTTHSEGCYKWHHQCAIAMIERARALIAQGRVESWGVFEGENMHDVFWTLEEAEDMARLKGDGSIVKPLYATPPQRQWVGLTTDEIWKCNMSNGELAHICSGHQNVLDFVEAIEAKLKEKNT